MIRYAYIGFLLIFSLNTNYCQSIELSREDKIKSLQLFKELLSIPNDAHHHEDIEIVEGDQIDTHNGKKQNDRHHKISGDGKQTCKIGDQRKIED